MSHGSSRNRARAITLMELLIALVLLCLIVLGISNIEVFCRFVFVGADRRAKIINEASYVIEHMSKNISQAVGDANNTPVIYDAPPAMCSKAVMIWTDNISKPANGVYDPDDSQIMYCFNNTTHRMTYFPDYSAAPGTSEVISRNLLGFNVSLSSNSVNVSVTGCWNASISTGPRACGSVDNPQVTIQTRIYMPSVSVNATP